MPQIDLDDVPGLKEGYLEERKSQVDDGGTQDIV